MDTNEPVKVAIVFCTTVKNELGCPATACLNALSGKFGEFKRYKNSAVQLVGIMTCAGCPTLVAPETILRRIKPLIEIGNAEKIHFSSCIRYLCPFASQFQKVINDTYPGVEVISGTEAKGDEHLETVRMFFGQLLAAGDRDISRAYRDFVQSGEINTATR